MKIVAFAIYVICISLILNYTFKINQPHRMIEQLSEELDFCIEQSIAEFKILESQWYESCNAHCEHFNVPIRSYTYYIDWAMVGFGIDERNFRINAYNHILDRECNETIQKIYIHFNCVSNIIFILENEYKNIYSWNIRYIFNDDANIDWKITVSSMRTVYYMQYKYINNGKIIDWNNTPYEIYKIASKYQWKDRFMFI
jgi:hypothetical protein